MTDRPAVLMATWALVTAEEHWSSCVLIWSSLSCWAFSLWLLMSTMSVCSLFTSASTFPALLDAASKSSAQNTHHYIYWWRPTPSLSEELHQGLLFQLNWDKQAALKHSGVITNTTTHGIHRHSSTLVSTEWSQTGMIMIFIFGWTVQQNK